MKNIFSEYINIVGYLVTGVVFFVCVSIMFNNIFNEVQSKVRYENKITHGGIISIYGQVPNAKITRSNK